VDDVISGTNHALGFTVLRGRVGARHPEQDAVGEKEGASGRVVEFAAVITLDTPNGAAELGLHIGGKISQRIKGFGFKPKRERPQKMRAIIKNDKIILVPLPTIMDDERGGRNKEMVPVSGVI